MSKQNDIEQKMAEIDEIISKFENGEIELGDAVENYKKAVKLAGSLQKDLDELKNKVEVISKDFSQEIATSSSLSGEA